MNATVDAFSYVMAVIGLGTCAFVVWYEYFRKDTD